MKNRNGLTLTELLVVIMIIAGFCAASILAFADGREKERTAACANNLKRIYEASMLYAQEFDGWMIPGRNECGTWWTQVMPGYGFNPRNSDRQVEEHEGARCPSEARDRHATSNFHSDYLVNGHAAGVWVPSEETWQSSLPNRLQWLPFYDRAGYQFTGDEFPWYADSNSITGGPERRWAILSGREELSDWGDRSLSFRHDGGTNIVMVAGNVETMSLDRVKELYRRNIMPPMHYSPIRYPAGTGPDAG